MKRTPPDEKDLCEHCAERSVCQQLCDKAEDYVNQDYVYLREITFTDVKMDVNTVADYELGDLQTDGLTVRQRTIFKLHEDGLSSRQIGRKLSLDDSFVRRTLRQIRNK